MIQTVFTPEAPKTGGHYSQATVHNGTVYVAGLLPIEAKTGEKKLGPIEEQIEQCFKNLTAILTAANSDLSCLLKVNIYLSDIGDWSKVNEIYTQTLGDHKPARVVVPTGPLHYGFKIEMDAVAAQR